MPSDNLVPINTASVRRNFFLRDASTGLALTGKTSGDFSGYRSVNGASQTSLSFAAGSAGDAYSSGKLAEIGNGRYCWHVPDAVFTTAGSSSATLICTGAVTVSFDWEVVTANRAAAAFGANTTVPDNSGITAAAASAATAATQSTNAATSAASADGKLTAGRLSRVDRLPDIIAGAAGGLSLVGSEMTLDSATLAALFADADVSGLIASITALFDGAGDLPIQTIAAQASAATVAAIVANGQWITLIADAAAANSAATTAASSAASAASSAATAATQSTTAATQSTAAASSAASADGKLTTVQSDLTAVKAVTTKVDTGLVADGGVWQFTVNMLELAPAGGGGGGGLTSGQAAQLDRVEAAVGQINGARLTVSGPVTPGGDIELILDKDYTDDAVSVVPRSISDVGGLLYAELTDGTLSAILRFGAGREKHAAQILTEDLAVSHAADVTTISIGLTAADIPASLLAGDDYEYQIERQTAAGARVVKVSGKLTLVRNRV